MAMNMDTLSPTARKLNHMVNDQSNIKFKSLFIDMDLGTHGSSNSPRLRKSLDSCENFEFTMSHLFMNDDSLDQAMEVASADKLFFKGQILPLQQAADRKRHLVQPMGCPALEENYCDMKSSFESLHCLNQRRRYSAATSEKPLGRHDSDKDCFTMICHNECINTPLQYCASQGEIFHSPHMRYANEEGPSAADFTLRDGIDIMRSCSPLDGTFGPDSCSSSSRSHHSTSFWSSAEKDSRDSISSSRCSNGSHQDSACIQIIEKKAPQIMSMQLKPSHPGVDQSGLCDIMGNFSLTANSSHRSINHHPKPPNTSSLSSRRWSWKGLFTGLRKATKLWFDDERGDVERQNIVIKGEKRPVFTLKELPGVLGEYEIGYRRSIGHDREWQANAYQIVSREGVTNKGRQYAKGSWGTLGLRDVSEDQQMGTIYCLRSGGRQETALSSSFDGGAEELTTKREKGKVQGNVSNAKERWNRCMSKMKKGGTKLSVSACKQAAANKELMESNISKNVRRIMNEEDKMDIHRVMMAKSLSSTPLAKSPVRSNNNVGGLNVGLYSMQGGASSSSSTVKKSSIKKVGFAASCPASMRSSPHHSGLLNAVVNKTTAPDLHTAIQGAIAHCKESQAAANPPP